MSGLKILLYGWMKANLHIVLGKQVLKVALFRKRALTDRQTPARQHLITSRFFTKTQPLPMLVLERLLRAQT